MMTIQIKYGEVGEKTGITHMLLVEISNSAVMLENSLAVSKRN